MKIAIVEDSPAAAAQLMDYLSRLEQETGETLESERYGTGLLFLDQYSPRFDIVLMDIEMPHMDGMETARRLRTIDGNVTLIFVTNMAQYAVRGYEVNAYDFVVKPVRYEEFAMKFRSAMGHVDRTREKFITVPTERGTVRLTASRIQYVEVMGHRLTYYTEDGSLDVRGSLSRLEEELEDLHFLRCNNCYLINPRYITLVGRSSVTVGGSELPISRPRKADFLRALTDYFASEE